eukprot:6458895-Amphidinium_carterae.1
MGSHRTKTNNIPTNKSYKTMAMNLARTKANLRQLSEEREERVFALSQLELHTRFFLQLKMNSAHNLSTGCWSCKVA